MRVDAVVLETYLYIGAEAFKREIQGSPFIKS